MAADDLTLDEMLNGSPRLILKAAVLAAGMKWVEGREPGYGEGEWLYAPGQLHGHEAIWVWSNEERRGSYRFAVARNRVTRCDIWASAGPKQRGLLQNFTDLGGYHCLKAYARVTGQTFIRSRS